MNSPAKRLGFTVMLLFAAILNAWAVANGTDILLSEVSVIHTNNNQVEVTVRASSTNASVKVWSIEYFMDSTNNIVNGRGFAMTAQNGRLGSTNEVAMALFTPTFPNGRARELFIHACGTDFKWTSFVKTVVTPSVDQILGKVRKNYRQIGGQ